MKSQQNTQILPFESQKEVSRHSNNLPEISTERQGMAWDDEPSLSDFLAILLRRKMIIITVALLVSLLVLLYTLSLTPVYRAEATLKIEREAGKLVKYDVFTDGERQDWGHDFFQTQYNLLKSRALARRVIDQLGLENTVASASDQDSDKLASPFYAEYLEEVTNWLRGSKGKESEEADTLDMKNKLAQKPAELDFLKNLTITPVPKSHLAKVSYESTDPELAALIVNTLAENFIDMNLEGRLDSASYAKKFLAEQIALAKSKLNESEEALVKYAKEKTIIRTTDKQSLVSSNLDILNSAYTEAKKERIDAESAYRQRKVSSGNIRALDNPVVQELKKKKEALKSEYQEKSQIYKPAYPLMVELRKQINEAESQIRAETKLIMSGSQSDLKTKYLAAKEKEAKLLKELSSQKKEYLRLQDKSIGYNTLQREVETSRQLYEGLLQRLKEVGVAGGVGTNNISIVDSAFVPYKKHKPDTQKNVITGILLGLLLGIGLAFFIEHMDDRVKSVDDLKKLSDYPVLGIFPHVKIRGRNRQPVFALDEPLSAAAEAFRSLVTNLNFATTEGAPKILHVTSASAGEAKSNTVLNVAAIFAEEEYKVLLIDADLRKPSVHKYLDIDNSEGLTNYLAGRSSESDVIQETSIPGLSVITAGASAPNPVRLLSGDRMLELLDYASDHFDYILIDSPPVMGLADALILSNRSVATLFAVASHESKKTQVSDALERLRQGYGNVIGFILTKAKSSSGSYYNYEHYYGGYQMDEPMITAETNKQLA
jgi:capsular exopolysaccharide synthesis family protein